MYRRIFIYSLLAIALTIGCSNNNNDEDFTYTLRVVNDFGQTLTVYLDDETSNEGFQERGIVPAQGEILISDLIIDTNYVLRAVEIGSVIENFVFEDIVINNSPTTREITVTITN